MAKGSKAESHILIVDDDQDVREVVGQILELEGFRVHHAANGGEALALLARRDRPDLILLNLTMPVMNGWAFRAEQLQRPGLAAIPVVLISSEPFPGATAQSLGIAHVLPKPIFVPDLLRLVDSALNGPDPR